MQSLCSASLPQQLRIVNNNYCGNRQSRAAAITVITCSNKVLSELQPVYNLEGGGLDLYYHSYLLMETSEAGGSRSEELQ